ncbi:MAG: hypothetical protein GTO18_08260 [Anaerolineales bacterium]|nr:hypothetical protein [Anaerolineales bacterium]
MAKKDWFRKTTWKRKDKEDFFLHLKRARDINKPQYVRIQAVHLHDTGKRRYILAALELIELYLENWPNDTDLAQAYLQQAECFASLGKMNAAIEAYRNSLQAQRNRPNVMTQAPINFGMYAIENGMTHLYKEAVSVLDEFVNPDRITFPIEEFRYNTILAIACEHAGQLTEAEEYATAAIEASRKTHSGLSYHPDLGLVKQINRRLHRKLQKLSGE